MNPDPNRPNIVVITADQWRGDCLGSLGSRHPVMTPHVDQLAAEGVCFTQAYADAPSACHGASPCSPVAPRRASACPQFQRPLAIDPQTSLPASPARPAANQSHRQNALRTGRAHGLRAHYTALTIINWLEDAL